MATHIPKAQTNTLSITPFEQALEQPIYVEDAKGNPWLYIPNSYEEYRYILGPAGKHPILVMGINPSTAQPTSPDRTIDSVSNIVHFNGFDSFIMLNIYPQRSTDPKFLDKQGNIDLHQQNLKAIQWVLKVLQYKNIQPVIWAAWGGSIDKRPYLKTYLSDIVGLTLSDYQPQWVCYGDLLKAGHPRHPLYQKQNQEFRAFDAQAYLAMLY